jgi:hypothetical protein
MFILCIITVGDFRKLEDFGIFSTTSKHTGIVGLICRAQGAKDVGGRKKALGAYE